jgi:metallo-beta-lactamase class B
MRLMSALVALSAAISSMSSGGAAEGPESPQEAGKTAAPFRVLGNIHFVGGQYGSYLITTPEGHVLHDTGSADMHDLIVSNVEKLG